MTNADPHGGGSASHNPWLAIAALVGFVGIALLVGQLGSLATTPNIPTWYDGLEKPWFNPPRWAFPVAWTILYVLMGVAAWLAWRAPERRNGDRRWAMIAYFVQLALNVSWSFAFFAARSPLAGLVVIVVLIAAIIATMFAFRRLSGVSALLLAPYLAWVAFATVLNATILALNG